MTGRRARRACLVVPGAGARQLEKAAGLEVDEVVLDLEDSVPPAEKSATRRLVANALVERDWRAPLVAVRVNAVASEWFRDDVVDVVGRAGNRLDALVVPKVESAEQLHAVDALVEELERDLGRERIVLEAQIESAAGLMRIEEIAAGSSRLAALIFGPGDYAVSLGIPAAAIGTIDPDYPGDQWHYPRSRIAVAAHAHGLEAIDGPFATLRDEEGLSETARRARLLGFTGKWVIHPDQIEACTRAFSPSDDEVHHAHLVLYTLREARRDGRGAAVLDGAMIDEASARLAEAVLARAGELPD